MAKTLRAALYLRVSTGEQTVANQKAELEEVAAARGWKVAHVYADEGISGSKGREARQALDLMMGDAVRRHFDLVLVWAVDRLGRSTASVAPIMAELGTLGIGFYAHKEGMDATTAHGRAMLQMASVFAELEREMIVERVKAGMARAKVSPRKGKKAIGRPKIAAETERAIRASLQAGNGILKTAKACGVGSGTVQRVKAGAQPAV